MAGRKKAPIVIERHMNSKRAHILDGDTCWCHPRVEEIVNEHNTTLVVIHNGTPAMTHEGQ